MGQRTIVESETELLLERAQDLARSFMAEAASSGGDFSRVEEAGESMIRAMRPVMMGCGIRASAATCETVYRCPECGSWLDRWAHRDRELMTSQGPARYRCVRYRCRSCHQDHYPLEERNGVAGQRLTLGARGVAASLAADVVFGAVARVADKAGIQISPSEADRVSREVSGWREEEERHAVEAYRNGVDKAPEPTARRLFEEMDWSGVSTVVLSVDGGKLRSPESRAGEAVWYEARAAVLAQYDAAGKKVGRTAYLGGVGTLDDIFCLLAAADRELVPKGIRRTFVADDGNGMAERARLFWGDAVHTLDIYHAGEHVGSAGAACFGERTPMAEMWRRKARSWLMGDDCARTVLRRLVHRMREPDTVADVASVQREFRYLWRNRHRMRYRSLTAQGMPISSAAMESGIKQTCIQRLRQPGMMWTRQGGGAMMRLRAAHLSGQLPITVARRAQAYAQAAARYSPATAAMLA